MFKMFENAFSLTLLMKKPTYFQTITMTCVKAEELELMSVKKKFNRSEELHACALVLLNISRNIPLFVARARP